jgi:hypothetical protein
LCLSLVVVLGILKAFSVGFQITNFDTISYNDDSDTWAINDIELHEISVVSVPANPESTFSVAKSLGVSSGEFKNLKNLKDGSEDPKPSKNTESIEMDRKEMAALVAEEMKARADKEAKVKQAAEARQAELDNVAKEVASTVSKQAAEVVAELESKLAESEAATSAACLDTVDATSLATLSSSAWRASAACFTLASLSARAFISSATRAAISFLSISILSVFLEGLGSSDPSFRFLRFLNSPEDTPSDFATEKVLSGFAGTDTTLISCSSISFIAHVSLSSL